MSAPHQSPTPYSPPSAAARAGSLAARVLWTAIPVGTIGLLAWVPAVHIARRRRTPAAWWWLAACVAGTVGEGVLVYTVPADGHGAAGDAGAGAGAYCVAYMIAATVYAWRGCGSEPRKPAGQPVAYPGYGVGWSQTLPYSTASTVPIPAPVPAADRAPVAGPAVPPPPVPTQAVPPVPAAAAHDMAAEIQAELRELRGFLGGEDAR